MPDFIEVHDDRFHRLLHGSARIDQLWTGGRWCEGPAYFPAGRYLVWSDIPNDRLLRWDETDGARLGLRAALPQPERPHRRPRGPARRLRAPRPLRQPHRARRQPHRPRRPLRGQAPQLPERRRGEVRRLDLVHRPDLRHRQRLRGRRAPTPRSAPRNVYRIDPDDRRRHPRHRRPRQAERHCLLARRVAALRRRHRPHPPPGLRAEDPRLSGVGRPHRVHDGHDFATCDAGLFDGFRVDTAGNVWSSAGDGVHVFAPDGTLLGKILIPEVVANVEFGGPQAQPPVHLRDDLALRALRQRPRLHALRALTPHRLTRRPTARSAPPSPPRAVSWRRAAAAPTPPSAASAAAASAARAPRGSAPAASRARPPGSAPGCGAGPR